MQSRYRGLVVTVLTCLSGFVGGVLSSSLRVGRAEAAAPSVLRTRQIELTDEADRARAILDLDPGHRVRLRLLSTDYATAVELGVGAAGSSSLIFHGPDGRRNVDLHFGFTGKPVLQMGDSESGAKLELGSVQADGPDSGYDTWALQFHRAAPRRVLAGISAATALRGKPNSGSVFAYDANGRLWAMPALPSRNAPK